MPRRKQTPEMDELVRTGRVPFFGFAVGELDSLVTDTRWRQSSTSSTDAYLTPDEAIPGAERIVRIDGVKVGVLVCGELFSPRSVSQVATNKPNVVVDLAHQSMTGRQIRSLEKVARATSCPVFHAQHLAGWYGRNLHRATRKGTRLMTATRPDRVIYRDDFWIAWHVETV